MEKNALTILPAVNIAGIADIFQRNGVRLALCFGSRAVGTADDRSDTDLIIIYETKKRFFDRYEDFKQLHFLISGPVEMLIYTPVEWENIKERIFFQSILKTARRIYVGGKKPGRGPAMAGDR